MGDRTERSLPDLQSWQVARARLNHDQLKNRLRPTLLRLRRLVAGEADSPDGWKGGAAEFASRWSAISGEVLRLIDSAAVAAGPRAWLSEEPLKQLSEADKAMITTLLERHCSATQLIASQRRTARRESDRISSLSAELSELAENREENDPESEVQSLVQQLLDHTQRLADSLTRLGELDGGY